MLPRRPFGDLSQHWQVRCGHYVTSVVDYVRRACRLVGRRPPVSTAAAGDAASPSGERKCGDGVDSACAESPARVAHVDAPAATAATATPDDVINCCSDDDTATSSVLADCVTESSALTYISSSFSLFRAYASFF